MGDTGMIPSSGTQGRSSGREKQVKVDMTGGDRVPTDHASVHSGLYVVRVTKGEERVLLHIDTERLAERRSIKAANDSIRRRTRG